MGRARTLLEEADRGAILGRLAALSPDARARWGRMSPAQMLAHVAATFRMALGDLPVAPAGRRLFHSRLMKYVVIRLLPFPRNVATAPELLPPATPSFEAERDHLYDLLGRLASGVWPARRTEHPLFGPLTRDEWGELGHKHLDHHLRQFGA